MRQQVHTLTSNVPAWQGHAMVQGPPAAAGLRHAMPALSVCVPLGLVRRHLLLPQQAAYPLACHLSLHCLVFLYKKKAIGSDHASEAGHE
jgi:hypothetical protein